MIHKTADELSSPLLLEPDKKAHPKVCLFAKPVLVTAGGFQQLGDPWDHP